MSNNTPANKEVIPIDIRKIRQTLGFSMKHMGQLVAIYSQGIHNTPIPDTRIGEWEFQRRAIPDYVFTASTNILLDYWSTDRHMTPDYRQMEVDAYYSAVLNRPLGHLYKLEWELSKSRNFHQRKMVKQIRKARIEQMKFLEKMLHIRMSYIFSPEPGPGDDDLEDVA